MPPVVIVREPVAKPEPVRDTLAQPETLELGELLPARLVVGEILELPELLPARLDVSEAEQYEEALGVGAKAVGVVRCVPLME